MQYNTWLALTEQQRFEIVQQQEKELAIKSLTCKECGSLLTSETNAQGNGYCYDCHTRSLEN